MARTMKNNRQRRRNNNNNNGNGNGPSRSPNTVLKRTFRHVENYQLNNTTGSGLNQYAYYSKYLSPQPEKCTGFKDAQQTFEFWRMRNIRVKAQVGYNAYNQTYNTINLDAVAAMQIWTAADFSANETVSGTSIMSYNNARVNTVSFNALKTIINQQTRINSSANTPLTILPSTTWLDTSSDMTSSKYAGFQLFARMPGVSATNYLPEFQLIFEYDIEFKQPAYQNRPSTFEADFVGSTLQVIPDASAPEDYRSYDVVSYTIDATGNNVRLERSDGQPGSLDFTQEEFWEVFVNQTSGPYFGNRHAIYTGPEPRKPYGWTPSN